MAQMEDDPNNREDQNNSEVEEKEVQYYSMNAACVKCDGPTSHVAHYASDGSFMFLFTCNDPKCGTCFTCVFTGAEMIKMALKQDEQMEYRKLVQEIEKQDKQRGGSEAANAAD